MSSSPPVHEALPEASFRESPADFVVEEIPAYAPGGVGEHLYVRFTKTGLTTDQAVDAIARHLNVDARNAGTAGLKDKHAITTQTASFPFPIARSHEGAFDGADLPGIQVHDVARHNNKLKPGHLLGNRFTITLGGLDASGAEIVRARLHEAGRDGVPNHFGPQRFGRDGDNAERTLAWLRGENRGPRDKRDQRFMFSAVQSMMFNEVLDARIEAGTWSTILLGDLAKKREGAIFPVREADLEGAVQRAKTGEVSPTGPMFGASMTWPEHEVRALEAAVLGRYGVDLDAFRHLGEGTRRSLVLPVGEMTIGDFVPGNDSAPRTGRITIAFVLPKGGYATTVLARACRLIETRPSLPLIRQKGTEE